MSVKRTAVFCTESSRCASVGPGDKVSDESEFESEWSFMVILEDRQKPRSTLATSHKAGVSQYRFGLLTGSMGKAVAGG